jgi:hypothetical protein
MAADPLAHDTLIAWAEAVQERTRLVQARAHDTSERLRLALNDSDEWFTRHGHKWRDIAWEPALWQWDR